MSQKNKNGFKIFVTCPAWFSFDTKQKFQLFLSYVPESLRTKNGLENDEISPAWYSFYTKHKFQPIFKCFCRVSERPKKDLKLT